MSTPSTSSLTYTVYIYLNEIVIKWQKERRNRNSTLKNQQLLTLLFATDLVIISIIEDNLQIAEYKLHQTTKTTTTTTTRF